MTVAVAFSDSDRGRAALKVAAAEAVLRREPLQVLQIVAGVDEPGPVDAGLHEKIAAQLADIDGLNWELSVGAEGYDTAEAVLELAESADASLLVIGSRRRTAVGKLLLGSVVQRVLLDSNIPVLVVKAS